MRIIILLLLWPCLAWALNEDQPPFFQINHNGNKAWLLGTIHVGTADFYPLPLSIQQAFEQAKVLAFEADPHDPTLAELLQHYGHSSEPLPPSLHWQVHGYCQRQQIRCDLSLSPWLLSTQLAMAQLARSGYQPHYGVESQLLANNGKRPLWQLEGMAKQMAIFDALSLSTQHRMLEASLLEDDPQPLIQAWRSGDHAKLYQLMQQSMAIEPELWQKLIVERNDNMAETIITWLSKQNGLFIAIGAGHLLGDEGIPMLLAQAGLQVTDCWQQHCDPVLVELLQ